MSSEWNMNLDAVLGFSMQKNRPGAARVQPSKQMKKQPPQLLLGHVRALNAHNRRHGDSVALSQRRAMAKYEGLQRTQQQDAHQKRETKRSGIARELGCSAQATGNAKPSRLFGTALSAAIDPDSRQASSIRCTSRPRSSPSAANAISFKSRSLPSTSSSKFSIGTRPIPPSNARGSDTSGLEPSLEVVGQLSLTSGTTPELEGSALELQPRKTGTSNSGYMCEGAGDRAANPVSSGSHAYNATKRFVAASLESTIASRVQSHGKSTPSAPCTGQKLPLSEQKRVDAAIAAMLEAGRSRHSAAAQVRPAAVARSDVSSVEPTMDALRSGLDVVARAGSCIQELHGSRSCSRRSHRKRSRGGDQAANTWSSGSTSATGGQSANCRSGLEGPRRDSISRRRSRSICTGSHSDFDANKRERSGSRAAKRRR